MKKIFLVFTMVSFLFGTLVLTSCGGDDADNTDDGDTTKTEEVADGPQPGEIPFGFPVVGTDAKVGEYVLAPSLAFIEDSWAEFEEGSLSTYIFYSAKVVEVGDKESKLDQTGSEVMIPNSLIIPLPAGQEAKVGDILLTWWQSGSGMERAIVVDDADPTQPTIVYLDASYDENGENEEQAEANSFTHITAEWQPGTFVAFKSDYYMEQWQVIRVEGDKVLATGWGGKMAVLDKASCTAIPVKMDVSVGDVIQIPYIGSYQEGTVTKIDERTGRIWVDTEFGGEITNTAVTFGEVTTGLNLD